MNLLENPITRRDFLKVSGGVAVMTQIQPASAQEWLAQVGKAGSRPDMVGNDAKLVRSVCLMCHSGCGIQGTIVNGELVKIDGNPYHPNTYDYVAKGDIVEESDLDGGLGGKDVGTLCAKGQAGVYALYSPNRLKHPLKRVGPRGSGKWKTVTWEQALTEICEGGMLFKDVPGEEARTVEGLKSILGNDKPIGAEDSDFMDEAPPEGYGPKRNQFVWAHGRNEQSPLTPRFVKEAAGVPHMLNHCDRCSGTLYNVIEHCLNVPPYEIGAYADYEYCTYLISVGSNVTHADYPGQTRARYLQKFAKRMGPDAKQFKHVVVDPWLSPAAAKAMQSGKGEWIPLKPASDAFFLIGMNRWMIDNKAYKADYLALPNEQAAKKTGRRNWTDMTYLVRTAEPKLYLTGKDAGLGQSDYVVLVGGKPTLFHDVDGPADLDAEVEIKGVIYKTVFRLLRERAHEKTIEECEKECDIPPGTIAHLAQEFARAKRPVIEFARGPIQQSNGWWNGQALITLNMMVDNIDRKGGYIPGHKAYGGDVKSPVKRSATGVTIDRHKSKYQGKKATSTRPWYPLASRTVTSEFFSSLRQGYPYRIKAYLNYYNDPAYTQPFNTPVIEALLDLKAMPLTFSIDANMGETSQLCDYVLPDTTYLERIGGFKTYPPVKTRVAGVRMPMVGTLDPVTKNYRGLHPDVQTGDDTLIQLSLRCGLPGFGKDGGGPGVDLFNSWQFWNEYFKNGDFKDEPGLDPNSRLIKLGGKFENPDKQYDADGVYTRFPGSRQVRGLMAYASNVAANKNSMTGKYYDGLPQYRTIIDCKEQPLDPALWKEYPFQLHTHKDAWHTQSRTMDNLWLASIKPQNFAEMNPADAQKLGVITGDWVKVKSPSSKHTPFVEVSLGDGWYKMQVRVTSRIRPGVFSVSNAYGRWGAGGRKWDADGKPQYYDKRIAAGFSINPLYMADPVLGDRVMCDPVAGGTQSNGTPLRVEKV
ncbi:MAG: molybdopterin-dependent oxidoreductase [Betaproteobacteria bacterium]|nr:molybdopterin-dependent oxidoreductase [Betaproteobacteria bacterium]